MSAAWVAAACAVVSLVLARWPGRWIWRLLRGTMRFLNDWTGEPARKGVDTRPGVMERLQSVEKIVTEVRAETRPDGGPSMRDVVHQTSRDVADVKADVAKLAGRVELFEHQRKDRDDPGN